MNQPNPTHAWGKRETVDERMGPGRYRRQALKVPVTNITKGPYIWICIESPVAFPCYYYTVFFYRPDQKGLIVNHVHC